MKKQLIFILTTSLLASSCGQERKTTKTTKKEDTKTVVKKASDKFAVFDEPPKFAYATQYTALEETSPETNLVARELYISALKYNYTLPEWPKSTEGKESKNVFSDSAESNYYNLKWTNGDNAKKTSEVAVKILERWESAKVQIGFIQTNPETKDEIVNDKRFQQAIKDKKFTGKLVLTGKNTSHVDLYNKKGTAWSDFKNVATFEFSQITTAYNTGYLTQSQFGRYKNSDKKWEKRTVGYIVTAQKKDDRKWNLLQMKKANAFRKGVMDAVKEQKTGEAKFVNKSNASDKTREKTLMFESSDIKKYFKVLKELNDYTDNDHSFVYYAGADAEVNDLVAIQLLNSSVTNSYGHKLVIETAGENEKANKIKAFGEDKNVTWKRGLENDQAVTGRVFMATKPWITPRVSGDSEEKTPTVVDITWTAAEKAANAYAIEAVLAAQFGKNEGMNYFGKHTYIGSFPAFTRVGVNGVASKAQKINTELLDKVRKHLYLKNIDIKDIQDEFLGSGL